MNERIITPFGRPKQEPQRPTPDQFMRGLDGAIGALDALIAQLDRHGPPGTLEKLRATCEKSKSQILALQLDVIARQALEIEAGVKDVAEKSLEMYEIVFGEKFAR